MDAIVTARVPVEVKEQVNALLKELGSSPTQLINEAYAYVLRHRELPARDAAPAAGEAPSVRTLTPEMRAELEACTLDVPQSFWDELGERSYKDALADWKQADYAALA